MAKKKAVKKNAKTASKAQKAKVAKKPAVKKTAKKASAKTSASKKAVAKSVKKAAKKTVKKAVKKAVKKTAAKPTPKPAAKKKSTSSKPRKIKSPLTKKQLKEFRELLLEKRKSLLGDMTGIQSNTIGRNLQESSGDLSTMPTHQADIGSDNFEYEFTLGLLESERALLREVHEAIERIDDGTYGVCLGTGDPIGIPRLKARPWCKYCIEYQKMIEKGLVRPGQDDSYGPGQDNGDDEDEDVDIDYDEDETDDLED